MKQPGAQFHISIQVRPPRQCTVMIFFLFSASLFSKEDKLSSVTWFILELCFLSIFVFFVFVVVCSGSDLFGYWKLSFYVLFVFFGTIVYFRGCFFLRFDFCAFGGRTLFNTETGIV